MPIVEKKQVSEEIDHGRKNHPRGRFDQICRPLQLWRETRNPVKYCVQNVSVQWQRLINIIPNR